MADKTYFRIAYGYEGYTHFCGAETRELALPIYKNMKKMYPFCKIEEKKR